MKRRRPSPAGKSARAATRREAVLSQDVWPRRRSAAANGPAATGRPRRALFDGVSPGNVERPKRRKSRAAGSAPFAVFRLNIPSPGPNAGRAALSAVLARLRITPAWVKTLAATLALFAAAVVGLNWESATGALEPQRDVSPASLEDPIPPLLRRDPAFAIAPGANGIAPATNAIPRAGNPTAPATGHVEPEARAELAYEDLVLNLTETFAWTPHVVAAGETVSGIAARHSLSQGSIIALNDIRETWNLQAGRTLKIPNMDGVPRVVRENDTLEGIARETGVPLNVLLDANDVREERLTPGQTLFVPGARMDSDALRRAISRTPERRFVRPVPGRITSGFGWREDPFRPGSGAMEMHRAVDLSGRTGDPVRAAMGGTVVHRGASPVLGNFIVLRHGGHHQTLYAHLSAFSVAMNEEVRQGQQIGRIGSTGRATGPHLHFAIFYRGEPVNPVDLWR